MKRSRAPSIVFKANSPSAAVPQTDGVNHLDWYKASSKENDGQPALSTEAAVARFGERLTRGRLKEGKEEEESELPPTRNIFFDEDEEKKVYFICHYVEVDAHSNAKCNGDGLLDLTYEAIHFYDMNSKLLSKSRLHRTTYERGDGRAGQQRVALNTQRRKELFLCEGQQVTLSRYFVEIGVEVEEEEVLDGTIFFRKDTTTRLMDVIKEKKKEKKASVILPCARLRRSKSGFQIPYKDPAGANKRPRLMKPLHSPYAPKAVVLWQPTVGTPGKVGVVVDPILGEKLRPHQVEGVQFMFDCITNLNGKNIEGNGCILADDMGLGKSLQAIAILWTLLKQGPDGEPVADRAIILCPSSLVQNWVCELKKWLGDAIKSLPIADSGGNAKKKLLHFEDDYDVLIISYDQLKIHCQDICKMKRIGLLIADEGHRLKNAHIKTTIAAAMIPTPRKVILSGTPIQNDLKEFYSMVSFVNPRVFGNEVKFRNVIEEPVLKGREPGADREDLACGLRKMRLLTRKVSPFILRRTFQTNMQYLPPKTECTIFCMLTDLQRLLYEHLLVALKEDVLLKNVEKSAPKETPTKGKGKKGEKKEKSSGRGSSPALSLLTTLKKLCNSPDLLIEMTIRKPGSLPDSVLNELKPYKPKKELICHPDFSSKVSFTKTLLLKIFRESDDRVVIVSMYKQTLEVLASLCKQNNIKFLQLDGETSIKKRQTLVDRLNDPNGSEKVMLLSSKAGGVGLNLIGANHLILFDGSWNPADDAQAMARVWRPGQKKECFIYRLLCTGTVEEKIYQRQLTKTALSARVVEQKKGTDGSNFSSSELRDLFKLRTETICETHDLLGCRCARREKTFGNSKVTVDELLSWEHVSDIANFSNSNIAAAGGGRASFMFLKRTDTKETPIEGAEVEKEDALSSLRGETEGDDEVEGEDEEAYEDEEYS